MTADDLRILISTNKEFYLMNRKVVTAIAVVIVVALIVLCVIFAPNFMDMVLAAHGMR